MARKANTKTDNYELVSDILLDQADLMLPHLSKTQSYPRLKHNLKELFRRLGETDINESDLTSIMFI